MFSESQLGDKLVAPLSLITQVLGRKFQMTQPASLPGPSLRGERDQPRDCATGLGESCHHVVDNQSAGATVSRANWGIPRSSLYELSTRRLILTKLKPHSGDLQDLVSPPQFVDDISVDDISIIRNLPSASYRNDNRRSSRSKLTVIKVRRTTDIKKERMWGSHQDGFEESSARVTIIGELPQGQSRVRSCSLLQKLSIIDSIKTISKAVKKQ
jgi:hypothetical protein